MTRWCGVLSRRLLAAGGCAAVMIGLAAVPAAAATSGTSGDSPSGFWYGTDSFPVTVTGSAPYKEPVIGGRYGGYIGMIGNWARSQGCGDKLAWSSANSKEANTNLARYRDGIGTGAYWFMGGPGMDPRYNGATTEAHDWGERQAAEAVAAIHANVASVKYPVVFMDVEIPGHAPGISPAPDNGWNDVYTSPCSGRVKATYVAASVDSRPQRVLLLPHPPFLPQDRRLFRAIYLGGYLRHRQCCRPQWCLRVDLQRRYQQP
jgi:hypothetical protein